jgi:hypothetical protein
MIEEQEESKKSLSPKACILNHARRRPPELRPRYKNEQEIIKTLLKQKATGLQKVP